MNITDITQELREAVVALVHSDLKKGCAAHKGLVTNEVIRAIIKETLSNIKRSKGWNAPFLKMIQVGWIITDNQLKLDFAWDTMFDA